MLTTNTGGTGNDVIIGSSADETFYGGNGTDIIYGAGGNDTLDGGSGANTLYGGGGDDTYIHNGFYSTLDILSETGSGGSDTLQMTGLSLAGMIHFMAGVAMIELSGGLARTG